MRKKSNTVSQFTSSAEETFDMGRKLAKKIKKGDIILLSGGLGSGKTCFVKGLAKGLGITQQVNSPTYVYIHPYARTGKQGDFFHVDLYRVESLEKLRAIGVEELLFTPNTILAIEWPKLIMQNYHCPSFRRVIQIILEYDKKKGRKITIIPSS